MLALLLATNTSISFVGRYLFSSQIHYKSFEPSENKPGLPGWLRISQPISVVIMPFLIVGMVYGHLGYILPSPHNFCKVGEAGNLQELYIFPKDTLTLYTLFLLVIN